MKKSSTRSSRVESGHMDSALRTACERDARVAATLLGEDGDASVGGSSLRFFMASACRFGGPRRRLGRSKVHGISKATQARHGGPDSSHLQGKQLASGRDHNGTVATSGRYRTFTFRTLHESHALRKRFAFCASPLADAGPGAA